MLSLLSLLTLHRLSDYVNKLAKTLTMLFVFLCIYLLTTLTTICLIYSDYVYTTPERNNAGRIYVRLHYTIKAAFHLRVFYTHVYARKNLNPSVLYIFKNTFTDRYLIIQNIKSFTLTHAMFTN